MDRTVTRKSELPVGSVILLGPVEYGTLAVKFADVDEFSDDGVGGWRYVEDGSRVDFDTIRKSEWDIFAVPD